MTFQELLEQLDIEEKIKNQKAKVSQNRKSEADINRLRELVEEI